jgi:hypothetical protein
VIRYIYIACVFISMSCVAKKASPPSRDRGARRAPLPSLLKLSSNACYTGYTRLHYPPCSRPAFALVRAISSSARVDQLVVLVWAARARRLLQHIQPTLSFLCA